MQIGEQEFFFDFSMLADDLTEEDTTPIDCEKNLEAVKTEKKLCSEFVKIQLSMNDDTAQYLFDPKTRFQGTPAAPIPEIFKEDYKPPVMTPDIFVSIIDAHDNFNRKSKRLIKKNHANVKAWVLAYAYKKYISPKIIFW